MRFLLGLFFGLSSIFLFSHTSFSQGRNLIIKLKPEFRHALNDRNSEFNQQFDLLNLHQPKRRFPLHQPPDPRVRILGKSLVDLSLLVEVSIPDEFSTQFIVNQFKKRPEVTYSELEEMDARPLFNPTDPKADSVAGNQRQVLRKIKAYQAWALSQGDTNVVIGLLDTGTPVLHEDMHSQIKINPLDPPNGVDDDGNGLIDDYQGWDFGSNDNDPTPDNTGTSPGHGTSVSSLAGAATNNAIGVAGVGFKCKILPVKIWSWAGSFSNFRGYDAIVYAADRGCKIINCSWGSARSGNQFEQDIITYATLNKGSIVVAAGGNTQGFYNFVPANYEHVVGVSMTDTSDQIVSVSSQNFKLDVAAPGVTIYGIKTDNSYGWVDGGSSMASPLVAGAIGLVRSKYPELNGLQAAELVRVNTDSIYQIPANAAFRDRSGRGRLNIEKALKKEQTISLRPVELAIRNKKGIQAQAGDTIFLFVRFENFLDSITGFEAFASTNSPKIQFLQSTRIYPALTTMESRWETQPFMAVVGNNVTVSEAINFRIQVRVGSSYSDQRWFVHYLNGRFLDLDANDIRLTVTANGRQGFMDNNNYVGSGIQYRGSQYCGEAGLMIGTGPTKVSNSVFNTSTKDDHFRVENNIGFQNYPGITQHAVNHCNDSAAGVRTIGVAFKQSAYELAIDSLAGSVFFNYQLKNRNSNPLDSICLAHYTDWDVENYDKNFAAWDSSLNLGYSMSHLPRQRFAAVQILTGGEPQFYAIDALNNTNNGNINLFDGLSLQEKWQSMSNGIGRKSAGLAPEGNNVVTVTGVKLRNFLAGETRKVTLAYLFADSLAELKVKAKANWNYFKNLQTSPSPTPKITAFCSGDSIVENFNLPPTISRFIVGTNAQMNPPIYTGSNFSSTIRTDSILYIAGYDSLFSGPSVAWQYQQIPTPVPVFSHQPILSNDSIPVGTQVTFIAADTSLQWINRWAINGLTQSDTGFSITKSFDTVGNVSVCLQQMHRTAGCQGVGCKVYKVFNPVSIQTLRNETKISLFPNPAKHSFSIKSETPVTSFQLFDLTGKVVMDTQPNQNQLTLSCQHLSQGIYIWKALTKSGFQIGKLLVE